MLPFRTLFLIASLATAAAFGSGNKPPSHDAYAPRFNHANPHEVDLQSILELAVSDQGSVAHFTNSLDALLRTSSIGAVIDVTSIGNGHYRKGDPRILHIGLHELGQSKPIEAYQERMNPNFLRALWSLPLRVYAKYKTLDREMCSELRLPLSLLKILLPKITPENALRFGFDPAMFREWAPMVKGFDLGYAGGYADCFDAYVLAVGTFENFVIKDLGTFYYCNGEPAFSQVAMPGGGPEYTARVNFVKATEVFDIGVYRNFKCDVFKNGFLKPKLPMR